MRSFIIPAVCLLASGCDQTSRSETPRSDETVVPVAGNTAIERDVANIQASVARVAETQRLDDLERRIGKLENTPEKLDLDLLSTRVQALEAKVGIDRLAETTVAVPSPTATPTRAPAVRARPTPRPRSSPTATLAVGERN